jgi:hypothetical protein
MECHENGIDYSKNQHLEILFEALKKKKMSDEHLFYVTGYELAIIPKDLVFVGMNLCQLDENLSIKRMKIDVYNELIKINYLERSDSLEYVCITPDMMIFDDKIKRLTKEDIDGLVQKNT